MKARILLTLALSVGLHLGASARASEEWVAHEWGTFTSVHSADGGQVQWSPLIKTDLPKFVYDRVRNTGGLQFMDAFLKGQMTSLLRMETPVICFYSDRARTAEVRVDFPAGRVTEWYPQATRVGPYQTTNSSERAEANRAFIEWKDVQVLPRDTKEITAGQLIREIKDPNNHYYAARNVDANFLRVASPRARTGAEYERDLFYRGVGYLPAPITARLNTDESLLLLSTTNSEPLTDLFVLHVRNGNAWFKNSPRLRSNDVTTTRLAEQSFAPLSDVQPKLMAAMVKALVAQGLFEKEAHAMVQTWKDQWFTEEGLRVLYLLPRAWTDHTLPLRVSPETQNTVRVMVGRAEILTPSLEWSFLREVVRYSQGDEASKQAAVMAVKRSGLGRFIDPIARKVVGTNPTRLFRDATWALAQAASEGAVAVPEEVVLKKVANVDDLQTLFRCSIVLPEE